MAAFSSKLRSAQDGHILFWCPGCDGAHMIRIAGPHAWGYNGNADAPTFTPSVLVQYNGPDADQPGRPPAVCHSFVTDGRIRFLGDSTHGLAGRTVDLPDFDEE